MTLGEYYRNKHHGVSFEKALEQVHNNIKSEVYSQRTNAECQELQDFLNHAFYPEKYGVINGQNYSKAIAQLITRAYEEKYNAAINNFSMGASGVGYGNINMETLPTLIRNKHETFKHSERIYVSTIEDRLTRVKTALERANSITAPEINEYKNQLRALEGTLQQLKDLKGVAAGSTPTQGAYFDLKGANSNLMTIIEKMDGEFEALSAVGGFFTPQDYGQVLEWILQAFSGHTDEAAEQIAESLVKEFTSTAGSVKTGASDKDFLKVTMQDISKETRKKLNESSLRLADETGEFGFSWVNKFDPDSSRQGKMDVYFTFNDQAGNRIPFRISAKNWETLDRDFGSTNVIYALLRSAGNESTVEYALAMQDKNNSNINAAHRLAKYSLLVDILMGYSQQSNYADTIVINLRSEQRVIVASIVDIVDQIRKDLDSFNLAGYNGDTINQRLIIIREALNSAGGRTEEYLALAMKYLQSIRVKLMYANIANAIRTVPTMT